MRAPSTCAVRNALQLLRTHECAAIYLGLKLGPYRHFSLGWHAKGAALDAHILKMLHDFDDGLHDRINARAALAARIAKCAVNGRVTIEESGRDCDSVQYAGKLHEIDANVRAFRELEGELSKWADGPFSLSILTPEEAQRTRYHSRDLVLEAFEDGHPHHITSSPRIDEEAHGYYAEDWE